MIEFALFSCVLSARNFLYLVFPGFEILGLLSCEPSVRLKHFEIQNKAMPLLKHEL